MRARRGLVEIGPDATEFGEGRRQWGVSGRADRRDGQRVGAYAFGPHQHVPRPTRIESHLETQFGELACVRGGADAQVGGAETRLVSGQQVEPGGHGTASAGTIEVGAPQHRRGQPCARPPVGASVVAGPRGEQQLRTGERRVAHLDGALC